MAILCIAYFVLIVCALSFGGAAEDGDRAAVRCDNEVQRRRAQRSLTATHAGAELPAVVAYARTTTEHEDESRRVARMIGTTVLAMQHGRRDSGDLRLIRCDRRTGAPDRPRARCH